MSQAESDFNELTAAEIELLALLAEECGECVQAIGKVLRHGHYSHNPLLPNANYNWQDLAKEMGHVRAAMILICDSSESPICKKDVHKAADTKLQSVSNWLHHNTVRSYDADSV